MSKRLTQKMIFFRKKKILNKSKNGKKQTWTKF